MYLCLSNVCAKTAIHIVLIHLSKDLDLHVIKLSMHITLLAIYTNPDTSENYCITHMVLSFALIKSNLLIK